MNPSKFDAIVTARAHERVQAKIEKFRKQVSEAINGLRLNTPTGYYHGFLPHDIKGDLKNVLDNVASGMYFEPGETKPLKVATWPRSLWDAEEAAVQRELLATMDEMQKALCAPAPTTDGPQPTPKAE